MHLFVYDDYVNTARHKKTLNKLETRLTDLGLGGKIIRLNNIRNIKNLIDQEIKAGIRNIYVVGNNESLVKIITALFSANIPEPLRKDLVLAIIPIGGVKQSIARSMGIYDSQLACNIILARLIKKINLGIIDDLMFVNKIEIFNSKIELDLFTDYSFNVIKKSDIKIINVPDNVNYIKNTNILSDDNYLDLIINKKAEITYINFKKAKIKGAFEALVDSHLVIKNPKLVQLLDAQVKFIVSKNRSF